MCLSHRHRAATHHAHSIAAEPDLVGRRDARPHGEARRDEAPRVDARRDPALRASDADREAVVAELREHGGAGRLDLAELEQRVGSAYAARTHGELAGLLADLPARPAVRRRPPRRRAQVHEWTSFAAVNLMLVAIWALTGAGYFWPAWVIAWWGFALAMKSAPWLRGQPWAGSSRSTSTSNAAAIRSTPSPLTRHQ